MEEKVNEIVENYKKTGSIMKTARDMNLSTCTVRKALLTAGVWTNKAVVDIEKLRHEHPDWSNSKIAEELRKDRCFQCRVSGSVQQHLLRAGSRDRVGSSLRKRFPDTGSAERSGSALGQGTPES